LLVAALLAFAALFVVLGVWQVKRLAWKEALIARVDAGIHAPPVPVLSVPADLPADQVKAMEYRRLSLHGQWLAQDTMLTFGPSSIGTGYWVLTPMRLDGGQVFYVNRGFVPMGTRQAAVIAATPAGPVDIVGLMRPSETKGGFMQPNVPAQDRWYSRDIGAIAARRHVTAQTAWFIDAQSVGPLTRQAIDAAALAKQPVAGLTVIDFPNNHLGYAITWFTLALFSLGCIYVVRRYRP
jgi:surfeit locus 1 family protein